MPFDTGHVDLHTDLENLVIGQTNHIHLILENPASNPTALVTVIVEVPNGLIIQETFGPWVHGELCTYSCEANFNIQPGDRIPETYLELSPRQDGKFIVKTDTRWEVAGNPAIKTDHVDKVFQVTEKIIDNTSVNIYTPRRNLTIRENTQISLTISNTSQKKMNAYLILEVPDGVPVTGAKFIESCTGTCQAKHEIEYGESKSFIIEVTADETGHFTIEEKSVWYYEDDPIPYGSDHKITLTVNPGVPATSEMKPIDTPTVMPTYTLVPPLSNGNGQGNLFVYIGGVAIIIVVMLFVGLALALLFGRKNKQDPPTAPNQPPNPPPDDA